MLKSKRILTLLLLIVVCFTSVTVESFAKEPAPTKHTLISQRSADFRLVEDEDGKSSIQTKSVDINFTTTQSMIFVIPIKGKITGDYKSYITGGLRIQLRNSDGTLIQNDYYNLNYFENGDWFDTWFYSDNYFQPAGQYTYTLIYSGDDSLHIDFSVIGYTGYAQKAKIKKKVSKASDNWVKIGNVGPGFPKVKESFSKKSVVPYIEIDKDGNVFAYCRKKGSAKVTIKLPNKKKYVTKVTVKAGQPNFNAVLYDYDTYGNYFTVLVENNGNSPLKIIRKGAKAIDVDYKSFNRKIKSQKAITVKPGQTKTVKFAVKGRVTWYDYEDFTIYAKVQYEGKTYAWHVWDEDSVYKYKGSWYDTYNDEEYYENWCCLDEDEDE